MNIMSVSKSSIADLAELLTLVNVTYRGESSKKGWTDESSFIAGEIRIDGEALTAYLNHPDICILKYTDENQQIVGCVNLHKKQDKLHLGMFAVHPELQAAGIGKVLLQAAEAHGKTEGCKAINLTVIQGRDELIAFYERRAYVRTGKSFPFPVEYHKFGVPLKEVLLVEMEKELTFPSIASMPPF